MKINNSLKNLIFYLFGLTGCNGLVKARLDCLPLEASKDVDTKQHTIPTHTQKEPDFLTTHMEFCKKAFLSKIDNYNACFLENLLKYLLNFEFAMPNYRSNCIFDDSDFIHQKMAGGILYIAHIIFKAFLKQHAAKFREFVSAYCFDPDFVNSIHASFQAASSDSDVGSGAHANNHFNLMEFWEFCKKGCLATLDNYHVGLVLHLMHALDLKFDMPGCRSNCIFDDPDFIHQKMAEGILYMAHIVFKAFLKKQAAHLRQFVYQCFSDPDFMNSLSTDCKRVSNALYAGAASCADFSTATARYVFSEVIHGVRYGRSCASDAMRWTVDAMYNGIKYSAFAINNITNFKYMTHPFIAFPKPYAHIVPTSEYAPY